MTDILYCKLFLSSQLPWNRPQSVKRRIASNLRFHIGTIYSYVETQLIAVTCGCMVCLPVNKLDLAVSKIFIITWYLRSVFPTTKVTWFNSSMKCHWFTVLMLFAFVVKIDHLSAKKNPSPIPNNNHPSTAQTSALQISLKSLQICGQILYHNEPQLKPNQT